MSGSESLTMTAGEICEMYRTAKKKSKQIGILAQLNSTTPARIAEILRAGGYEIDGRSLRYAKAAEGDGEQRIATAPSEPRNDSAKETRRAEVEAPYEKELSGGEAADTHNTHTHTPRAGQPVTVRRLREILGLLPEDCEICLGEEPLVGYSYAEATNLLTGEIRKVVQLI